MIRKVKGEVCRRNRIRGKKESWVRKECLKGERKAEREEVKGKKRLKDER